MFGHVQLSVQYAEKLNAVPTIILPVQGILKFYTYCKFVENNRVSFWIVHDIYAATTNRMLPSYAIMLRSKLFILSIVRIFSMIIISTLSVVLLYPLFVFVLRAQSEPMLPLFVPGINETSTIGFGLLSGLHSVWATQGAVGMMFSDMFYKVML